MKYAEFNIDSNKIEFLNSIFGIESVLLNGKRISKKFSFSGITHEIKLQARDLILESKYKQFDKKEIKLELKENGVLLKEQFVKIDKKQTFFWMLIGVTIGIAFYKLLNLLYEYLNV
ncbi:hypothetical protein BC952_1169 [Flavobacterium limicola]|uniref:Uncharacterized protein n=1 Tax=Flavobacterium limicola TaxID=180441 RepID=A0A495S6Q9_9FLAO|nr:hypothetical protein [Flavobacterium limicola]RKS95482.1 hypothetical protein BC952_1169 [Flavobacterium limicola]